MASAGGNVLRRAERPGRVEVASDGGSIRQVCDREFDGGGVADREERREKRGAFGHVFVTATNTKGLRLIASL